MMMMMMMMIMMMIMMMMMMISVYLTHSGHYHMDGCSIAPHPSHLHARTSSKPL